MSDYIKREDAINLINVFLPCNGKKIYESDVDELLTEMEHLPPCDVVEVIKCKDCDNYDSHMKWCNIRDSYGFSYMPDDFCSYGERADK